MNPISGSDPSRQHDLEAGRFFVDHTRRSVYWLWQLVMGFALVEAVRNTVPCALVSLGSIKGIGPPRSAIESCGEPTAALFLFPLGFAPIFFRFYFGNRMILAMWEWLQDQRFRSGDESYIQLVDETLGSRGGRFLNLLFLGVEGMFIIGLSQVISYPLYFLSVFALLLLFDVALVLFLWDQHSKVTALPASRSELERGFGPGVAEGRTLALWLANSGDTFLLFVLLSVAWFAGGIGNCSAVVLGVLLCSTNSCIDMFGSWRFYFPTLRQIFMIHSRHDKATKEAR